MRADDSSRPDPFGPKPTGRTYEKTHQRPPQSPVQGSRAAPPEQQRARTAPPKTPSDFVPGGSAETGIATYSGRELDGRPTASGEIFSSNDLTAAHPRYPIGTLVRVTNLSAGKSVVVRINDRIRESPNRVIQVTKRAADEIGLIGTSGANTVKVEPSKPR